MHCFSRRCSRISRFAASARARLNSKVYTCPFGATARTSACVSDALPVPDSSTTLPGLSSSACATSEMSGAYKICVRCGSTLVQSSGVGASSQTKPLPSPLPYTLAPKGLPTHSRWKKLPYRFWYWPFSVNVTAFCLLKPSYTMTRSPICTVRAGGGLGSAGTEAAAAAGSAGGDAGMPGGHPRASRPEKGRGEAARRCATPSCGALVWGGRH